MANSNLVTILISALVGGAVAFVGNLLMQNRTRWLETQSYGSALAREMLLITRRLEAYSKALSTAAKQHRPLPRWPIRDDDLLIFKANTSKIGLLKKPLALSLMKFYQRVRDLSADVDWVYDADYRKALEWSDRLKRYIAEVDEVVSYGRTKGELLEAHTSASFGRRLCNSMVSWLKWRRVRPNTDNGER